MKAFLCLVQEVAYVTDSGGIISVSTSFINFSFHLNIAMSFMLHIVDYGLLNDWFDNVIILFKFNPNEVYKCFPYFFFPKAASLNICVYL